MAVDSRLLLRQGCLISEGKHNMRLIKDIAKEICADIGVGRAWSAQSSNYARPYVRAMLELNSLDDYYHADKGVEIVIRFLCNSQSWRGDTARRVKAELRSMLKGRANVTQV